MSEELAIPSESPLLEAIYSKIEQYKEQRRQQYEETGVTGHINASEFENPNEVAKILYLKLRGVTQTAAGKKHGIHHDKWRRVIGDYGPCMGEFKELMKAEMRRELEDVRDLSSEMRSRFRANMDDPRWCRENAGAADVARLAKVEADLLRTLMLLEGEATDRSEHIRSSRDVPASDYQAAYEKLLKKAEQIRISDNVQEVETEVIL